MPLLILLLLLLTLSLGQQCDGRSQGCHGSSQAGNDCKGKAIMIMISKAIMIMVSKDKMIRMKMIRMRMAVVKVNTEKYFKWFERLYDKYLNDWFSKVRKELNQAKYKKKLSDPEHRVSQHQHMVVGGQNWPHPQTHCY